MSGVFTLYRFFGADGTLLYVGQTVNPPARIRDHQSTKAWWDSVENIAIETFPDAEALDHAERRAITNEGPAYNIALNPERPTVSNGQKRETLEAFGWTCISNSGAGTFIKADRPGASYTRAAAWTQLQR